MIIYKTSNEKLLFGCFVGALLGIFVLGSAFLYYRKQISNYVQVEAKLEGVLKEYGQTSETDMNVFHYASYSYTYEDREYTAQREVLAPWGLKAGEKAVIKINPDNPTEIEDTMRQKIFLAAIIGCMIVMMVMFKPAMHFLKNYF